MRFVTREANGLRVRRGGTVRGAILGAILAVIGGLQTAAADPYRVTGVPIDATAENATAARERAMADGQRRALERLFDRLVDPSDRAKVTLPGSAAISSWVASIEIGGERRSAVRYLARLTVTFADQTVRDYFRELGVLFADTASPPILVLPVLQQGDQLLFGGSNPWRAAWQTGTPEGLVQFVLPGDPDDPADAIAPAQVAAADDALLDRVFERYAMTDVLVAQLTEGPPGSSGSLRAVWLGPVGRGRVLVQALPESIDNQAASYQHAVEQVAKWAEDVWRVDNLVRSGEAHDFESAVVLKTLSDWIAVQSGLSRITAIRSVDVLSFARQQATVRIRYNGSPEQLSNAMNIQGLQLTRVGDGWEISPSATVRGHGDQR